MHLVAVFRILHLGKVDLIGHGLGHLLERGDCERLSFASDLAPAYAKAFAAARARGVEAYAVRCDINLSQIIPRVMIPVIEPADA